MVREWDVYVPPRFKLLILRLFVLLYVSELQSGFCIERCRCVIIFSYKQWIVCYVNVREEHPCTYDFTLKVIFQKEFCIIFH